MEYRQLPHGAPNERFSVIGLGLGVKADACLHCGHCESRCPFGVKQERRMEEINRYFG